MTKITNARFAQWTARLAKVAASWTGDILDATPNGVASGESVERFIKEMRTRLDFIEQEAGLAPEEPKP